jgi:HNH endonuclease
MSPRSVNYRGLGATTLEVVMPGKPSIERSCEQCGATFFTWPVHIRKGNGRFCSRGCASRSKTLVSLADRVWPKVRKTDGCWFWFGAHHVLGYGQIQRGRRGQGSAQAHRVVYELVIGAIPAGLELDHLCRQPSCVRPDHLEPVTPAENKRRALSVSNLNAVKATCNQGHPFDDANTYVRKEGHRMCRTCHRERERGRKQLA